MFLGEYAHFIDDKGRLTIPAKFRAALSSGVVVTQGLDGCLSVYPLTEWERITQKINTLPLTSKDARNFRRLMYGEAANLQPDRLGRVLIPKHLREIAEIDGETLVIGLHTHLEIWNPQRWQEIRSKVEKEGESIAEHLGI
ncbi:MAG: division/cell wall cluster transcriptional repressor MraZ [Chloroflexi bacterium]|nr:division/cell wall cluster transcriptional repressor MraZ [Chloroflexota bacterium]